MPLPQRINEILSSPAIGTHIQVTGWLRSCRNSKEISFLDLNDGSGLTGLQVVADKTLPNYESEIQNLSTACAITVHGLLQESPAKGQAVELLATTIEIVGWSNPALYPLQKKRHSLEFLRTLPHLRGRTNSLSAMMRIRNCLSFAVHRFFQHHAFQQLHTPIITTSDCEGAGEMFTVTSLDLDNLPKTAEGQVSFAEDFFSQHASLTVSGQLEAEAYALAVGPVYTFGPTFRAENSHTSRHLAEFWMVEPEIPFCDLTLDMEIAEEMMQFLVAAVIEECPDDIDFFSRFVDKKLAMRLEVMARPFHHITYSDAINQLQQTTTKFNYPINWGVDLQSEHEKFLTDEIFKGPVIVTDYPKNIKPFYMRCNDDGKTVAAMDILAPSIGEIIGGSQREERLTPLEQRMAECHVSRQEYDWYLDLRRFGSVPHAGFGLGFERMVLLMTGLGNIRDVIPFPRTPGGVAR